MPVFGSGDLLVHGEGGGEGSTTRTERPTSDGVCVANCGSGDLFTALWFHMDVAKLDRLLGLEGNRRALTSDVQEDVFIMPQPHEKQVFGP